MQIYTIILPEWLLQASIDVSGCRIMPQIAERYRS